MALPTIDIRPQPGPQEAFLASSADIAIYGGAAGGGKSWSLLLEPIRHVTANSKFYAVVFRRTLADAKKPGATWDQMGRIYPLLGGKPRYDALEYRFPGGGKVAVGHLEHETTKLDWQSAEVPLLLFDELTHFTRSQFFYMLSRNRSMCGVRPYVRATTNPDAESWVASLIAWWIDAETGLPIAERGGKIRWFVNLSDELVWADEAAELARQHPGCAPKSLTFIPARLEDNKILVAADPGYRANLMALPLVERERLLGGNWKVRPSAGLLFKRHWCQVVEAIPEGTRFVRGWDLAATPKTETNDPDFTATTKIGRMPDGRFLVAHHARLREGPMRVRQSVENFASQDGKAVRIALPRDPAQAGKDQAQTYAALLAGYDVRLRPVSGKGGKISNFNPFSAQAEAGNVCVLRGPWNEEWFNELEAFPDGRHDDDADATSIAFNELTGGQAIPIVAPIVVRGRQ